MFSRGRLRSGKGKHIARYIPHMKHDLLCLPQFNVLESLLYVASSERPIKIPSCYNVESFLSKDIRYSVNSVPEF
jgi:hypothetical protein